MRFFFEHYINMVFKKRFDFLKFFKVFDSGGRIIIDDSDSFCLGKKGLYQCSRSCNINFFNNAGDIFVSGNKVVCEIIDSAKDNRYIREKLVSAGQDKIECVIV